MRPRASVTVQEQDVSLGPHSGPEPSFEPWQLFTLAGLIGATIAVFMARGESPAAVIMISLTIFAAAVVGIAALRTFLPLTQKSSTEGARMLGGRTRVALEREKTLVLRSIKELEFDRAMGKVSEKDFAEMSGRLRSRATRLMRQLDATTGYRSEIDREIAKRIGPSVSPSGGSKEQDPPYAAERLDGHDAVEQALLSRPATTCASCNTSNDPDARFCKHCGHTMEARS
jgi:hypothetical protein